jgi:copper(I)-binding protein
MFVNLTGGLVAGTTIPVTLTFEVAGTVELSLVVFPVGSPGPAPAAGVGP